ncbi:MAG: thioredoxin-like domain-containing protein [Capnocytophaga sp.]|nr:thioredoxin-like domain-containing protein [Capnocytophaga sp.]
MTFSIKIGKTKEALKGKDVVFMYFANRSPEDSWKNVIKQYDLTGENVVHYNLPKEQQDMLERRLGINSFPTYMIMDKSGTIVDMNPARPMQSGRLTEQLNGWIEK